MTGRYGDTHRTNADEEDVQKAGPARQALTAGRLILHADDDGVWSLRWLEQPHAPRLSLTVDHVDPLDEAYRLARLLQQEADSAYVSVTLSEGPDLAPASSTASGPRRSHIESYEVALRCRDMARLLRWADDRLRPAGWLRLDPTTHVERVGMPPSGSA